MPPSRRLILAFCLLAGCTASHSPSQKQGTFRVLLKVMPDSSAVFWAGDHPRLGLWRPNSIALEGEPDGSWRRTFAFHPGVRLEYKIPRGCWQTEAVNPGGVVPPNSVLEVTNDTTVIIEVAGWKDLQGKVEGQITGTVVYHRVMTGKGLWPRDVIFCLPPGYGGRCCSC